MFAVEPGNDTSMVSLEERGADVHLFFDIGNGGGDVIFSQKPKPALKL